MPETSSMHSMMPKVRVYHNLLVHKERRLSLLTLILVYFHQLDEYARLCGFPDGVLVKIAQVQKYTIQTAGKAAEVEVSPISE
jgi:hypothetical protein